MRVVKPNKGARPALTPVETLAAANRSARQSPTGKSFVQARQVYIYAPGAIYELYGNPNFVSTILLESGETPVESAPHFWRANAATMPSSPHA